SAPLYWTPISMTSRLSWFNKERAGGRSGTSRASFPNSEPSSHPEANICDARGHVRFGPEADIRTIGHQKIHRLHVENIVMIIVASAFCRCAGHRSLPVCLN